MVFRVLEFWVLGFRVSGFRVQGFGVWGLRVQCKICHGGFKFHRRNTW